MKIKDIIEVGFYKEKSDSRPNYIFEVLRNTDKIWLEEDPRATLLVDRWIYDFTDSDDRRHYVADGSLTTVYLDMSDCELEKVTENFKVQGDYGTELVEDIPTYKQRYRDLLVELEATKALKDTYLTCYRAKHNDIEGRLFTLMKENEQLRKKLQARESDLDNAVNQANQSHVTKEDSNKLCSEEDIKPLDEVFQKDDNDDYVITKNGLVYIRTTGNYSGLRDRTTHKESLSSTHLNSIPVQVGSVLSIYTDGEIVASNFMPF